MIATVHPACLKGRLRMPASKSVMQRTLAASLIRNGRTLIWNPGHSADDMAALRCIRALGAKVELHPHHWEVQSMGIHPTGNMLDCGESGLSIRMFTPLAAIADQPMHIAGAGSLAKRPMHFFQTVLPDLGVAVQLQDGRLPILIRGPLQPKSISVDGSLSSQFLTGILMSFSATKASGVCIEVNDLKSRPYVDLTLQTLHRFGLPVPVTEGYQRFTYGENLPAPVSDPLEVSIEGDWSGASFWLAAAPFTAGLELEGLALNSVQGDRAMLSLFEQDKKVLDTTASGVIIHPHALNPFTFDATDCPDLFPPLVALAAHLIGTSSITGVHRLAHKESDRAKALCTEYSKLGLAMEISGDQLLVHGSGYLKGGAVSAHGDHRIAMSLAIAALHAEGPVLIEGAESVAKSYPDFWKDLQTLGATVSLSN